MATLGFRAAHLRDLPLLLELMQELYGYEERPFQLNRAEIAMQQLLDQASLGQVYFVIVNTEIAGYVVLTFGFSLEFGGRDAFIDELYLKEAYRGQGIGGKTLEFVAQICRTEKIQALHLEVDVGNQRAQTLYEKAGFLIRSSHLMSKSLHSPIAK
jgi:ribosomal protein S18 acetylase RimI-like enzyme